MTETGEAQLQKFATGVPTPFELFAGVKERWPISERPKKPIPECGIPFIYAWLKQWKYDHYLWFFVFFVLHFARSTFPRKETRFLFGNVKPRQCFSGPESIFVPLQLARTSGNMRAE